MADPTPGAGQAASQLEKVIVFPRDGGFRVVPPSKRVRIGQPVTWQAFDSDTFELILPDVFDDQHPAPEPVGPKIFRCQSNVKQNAAPGVYQYRALCNGQDAQGNSSPEIIIDP